MNLIINGVKKYQNLASVVEVIRYTEENRENILVLKLQDNTYSISSIEKYFLAVDSVVVTRVYKDKEQKMDFSHYNKLVRIYRESSDNEDYTYIELIRSE